MAKIIETKTKGVYQIRTWFGTKVKVKYKVYDGKVYIRPLLLYSIRDCWSYCFTRLFSNLLLKKKPLNKKQLHIHLSLMDNTTEMLDAIKKYPDSYKLLMQYFEGINVKESQLPSS